MRGCKQPKERARFTWEGGCDAQMTGAAAGFEVSSKWTQISTVSASRFGHVHATHTQAQLGHNLIALVDGPSAHI